ncbi:MAG: hypothetical protein M3349_05350 [Actinomycetota bacterium]|nr:hypothetical protein [Actinomycetota bacterium]
MPADSPSGAAAETLIARCAAVVGGRKIVVVGGVLAGWTQFIRQIRGYGATQVLVVAQGTGTGELPTAEEATTVVIPPPPTETVTEEIRTWIEFSANPPPAAMEAVEAFDPGGEAVCLLDPFATVTTYCGREALGGRTDEMEQLEDKTLADGIWDAAGLRRAPSVVVPVDRDLLGAAHAGLDRGYGTVWSGDAAEGMNGGADRVRWVRSEADVAAALVLFSPSTRHVRVMPFLEGVPCSIHGFVLPDGVAAFRPLEQIVVRHPDTGRFTPAGLSTCWDPPETDREEMRTAARSVGELIGDRFGHRGGFAVDGVLTGQGFLPTELNSRFSGGLGVMARGMPDLPLGLVQMATMAGVDLGISAEDFERLLVETADRFRFGQASAVSRHVSPTSTETIAVCGDPQQLTEAADGDNVVGTVELGPANVGALVRYRPVDMAPGLRLAPYAVAALRFADERWQTGFGPLEMAANVRTPDTHPG